MSRHKRYKYFTGHVSPNNKLINNLFKHWSRNFTISWWCLDCSLCHRRYVSTPPSLHYSSLHSQTSEGKKEGSRCDRGRRKPCVRQLLWPRPEDGSGGYQRLLLLRLRSWNWNKQDNWQQSVLWVENIKHLSLALGKKYMDSLNRTQCVRIFAWPHTQCVRIFAWPYTAKVFLNVHIVQWKLSQLLQ